MINVEGNKKEEELSIFSCLFMPSYNIYVVFEIKPTSSSRSMIQFLIQKYSLRIGTP